jgi:cysteinyl-tRNA synthetase
MGLLTQSPLDWLQGRSPNAGADPEESAVYLSGRMTSTTSAGGAPAVGGTRADDTIDPRIAARTLARKERRFADADRLRDELAADGILLEDGPSGTTWRRA